jgi:hypothetical protein
MQQQPKKAAFSGLVMDRQFERAARWLSVRPSTRKSVLCVREMMDWFSSIGNLIGAALRARLMHLQFCYAFIQTETRSERSSQKSGVAFLHLVDLNVTSHCERLNSQFSCQAND